MLVNTGAIEDATCDSLKNDPNLNIISCCTTATVVSRRLSDMGDQQERKLQIQSEAPSSEPTPDPNSGGSAPPSGLGGTDYTTQSLLIVGQANADPTPIEMATVETAGEISTAIGGSSVTETAAPTASPSSTPSAI